MKARGALSYGVGWRGPGLTQKEGGLGGNQGGARGLCPMAPLFCSSHFFQGPSVLPLPSAHCSALHLPAVPA